ncbi:MAG: acetate--CoA ligase family protein [Phycisphaerales bacterium]|nr:acetate--CoA ligase family protein [Phycisphaerales bacterium]
MARLHEYQGKELLAAVGIETPRGGVARSADEAQAIAATIGLPVVMKIQAWMTGRKKIGGVAFVETADGVRAEADKLLTMTVGNFPVTEILVEEMLPIDEELFVSLSIDDASRQPVMLLALEGGSGIEDRAASVHRLSIDVKAGVDSQHIRLLLAESKLDAAFHDKIVAAVEGVWTIARKNEARSVEVNPLVTTTDGRVIAADCRMTIDDYAVFRHPELGIDIARELDHPPTELERIAYSIEQDDHRGTFYFAQLPVDPDKPKIGFHGAGGGGSMMSMDAISNAGFAIANFTDTSGNPSVAKVYRAARIILSQDGLVGYFGSGSGVASQEQYHSAYGLAKAFIEMDLAIPAVIRLGGNSEDRAVEILQDCCENLPATVEGYRKDDTPSAIAERFKQLVNEAGAAAPIMARSVPAFAVKGEAYSFPILGGRVFIDHEHCDAQATAMVTKFGGELFKEENGKPVLAVSEEDVAKKDSDLIACEMECYRAGKPVVFVDLLIPGLDD